MYTYKQKYFQFYFLSVYLYYEFDFFVFYSIGRARFFNCLTVLFYATGLQELPQNLFLKMLKLQQQFVIWIVCKFIAVNTIILKGCSNDFMNQNWNNQFFRRFMNAEKFSLISIIINYHPPFGISHQHTSLLLHAYHLYIVK